MARQSLGGLFVKSFVRGAGHRAGSRTADAAANKLKKSREAAAKKLKQNRMERINER